MPRAYVKHNITHALAAAIHREEPADFCAHINNADTNDKNDNNYDNVDFFNDDTNDQNENNDHRN